MIIFQCASIKLDFVTYLDCKTVSRMVAIASLGIQGIDVTPAVQDFTYQTAKRMAQLESLLKVSNVKVKKYESDL